MNIFTGYFKTLKLFDFSDFITTPDMILQKGSMVFPIYISGITGNPIPYVEQGVETNKQWIISGERIYALIEEQLKVQKLGNTISLEYLGIDAVQDAMTPLPKGHENKLRGRLYIGFIFRPNDLFFN